LNVFFLFKLFPISAFVAKVASDKFISLGVFTGPKKKDQADALGEVAGKAVVRTVISQSYTKRVILWSKATSDKLKEEHDMTIAATKVRGHIRATKELDKKKKAEAEDGDQKEDDASGSIYEPEGDESEREEEEEEEEEEEPPKKGSKKTVHKKKG
jgi:hypothetical protein